MRKTLLPALFLLFAFACKQEDAGVKSRRVVGNPNGTSSLAVLMQDMTSYMKETKASLNKSRLPSPSPDFFRITDLEATPGMISDTLLFEELAVNWLIRLEALHSAPAGEERKAAFIELTDACLQCHQHHCQGPIPTIRELKNF